MDNKSGIYCGACRCIDEEKKHCLKYRRKLSHAKYSWGTVYEMCDECKKDGEGCRGNTGNETPGQKH